MREQIRPGNVRPVQFKLVGSTYDEFMLLTGLSLRDIEGCAERVEKLKGPLQFVYYFFRGVCGELDVVDNRWPSPKDAVNSALEDWKCNGQREDAAKNEVFRELFNNPNRQLLADAFISEICAYHSCRTNLANLNSLSAKLYSAEFFDKEEHKYKLAALELENEYKSAVREKCRFFADTLKNHIEKNITDCFGAMSEVVVSIRS